MDKPKENLRVLMITRNFPPLTGGMERLMLNAGWGISEWADLTIVGPRGCEAFAPKSTRVYEVSSALIPFLLFSVLQSIRAILFRRFDVILGGSGLVAPVVLLLRLLNGGKTAIFLHGLDLIVKSRVYQAVFVPCIRRTDLCIANSRNTMRIATEKGVPKQRVTVVHPGTDLPDVSQIESRTSFCRRYDIPFQKIIIFVGRMTQRKGLSMFIENSLPGILQAIPGSGLVVTGDNPNQGLTSFGEQERVFEKVSQLELDKQVRFLGQLTDDNLLSCYAAADVLVFPLIDMPGDVEGFGMVATEAAASGTPTVAFNLGGVADAVGEGNGRLVPSGDYPAFSSAVLEVLLTNYPTAESCIEHAQQFSWERFHSQIRSLLDASPHRREQNTGLGAE